MFSLKVCVCYSLVGLTRRLVSARLFSLPQLTNNSWKMSVNDQHVCSKCWWMMVICPEMKDKHVLQFFSPLCKFCLGSVGLSLLVRHHRACCVLYRHNPRAVFVPRETNISWKMSADDQHFCSICLSMMFICPEMKDNHVLHLFLPLCMFCLGSVGLSLLVRPHRACCFLYRHSPLAVFGSAGDQHSLKNVCQWPTFLGKCLSMTNIPLKMSVNDQHFLKNVCQWPTFLEKCLLITNILAVNVG